MPSNLLGCSGVSNLVYVKLIFILIIEVEQVFTSWSDVNVNAADFP